MVMDAQPSPQSVGREFVRQYYTLLNKAPHYLHRFYTNHSSFIHDGLDTHNNNREATLVIGQKNIHNKIQQLNFRDCHAKISQVDAQATLGNGVVVQVTGELSNDGQPMRRFTQTFVLAPQSPKNYYVHNDIFRYQDMYSDDENEGESLSENGEEQDNENKLTATENSQQSPMAQPQQIYYQLPTAPPITPIQPVGQTVPLPQFPSPQQQPQVNGVVHDELMQVIQPAVPAQTAAQIIVPPVSVASSPQQSQPPQQQPTVTPLSTPIASAMSTSLPTPAPVSVAAVPVPQISQSHLQQTQQPNISSTLPIDMKKDKSQQPITIPQQNISSDVTISNEPPTVGKQEPEILKKDEFNKVLEQSEKIEAVKPTQNEPKTYANLFKTVNTTSSSNFVPLPTPSHQISSTGQSPKPENRSENSLAASSMPQRTNSRQMKDFGERRVSNVTNQFVDSHQLFLGNVPHHATEAELKALFSKFGTVIDLRIHSKPVSKVPGVRLPPYYGFITYEDPESVQNCLANCPLYFPDNSPDGQKLNVEEKKTRLRPSNDMPRMPNNMTNSGGMNNSQRSSGGGANRSLSNTGGGGGGMMRGPSGGGNGSIRGSASGGGGGPRTSGFNRNDNRGPGGGGGGGQQNRGNGNAGLNAGGNYGRR